MSDTPVTAPLDLTTINGQRVLWAPSSGPRSHAGLMFRVGQADESLKTRGITHLLEHLALAGTDLSVDHNGQTDLLTTTFTVSGSLDEIDAHLSHVVTALTQPPTARIEVEKQILHAEEDGRSSSILQRLALYRYGATGIGLADYPEFGVDRIDAAQLTQWSQHYFTADNSVLVILGPERPERLSWQLPAGSARPAPAPVEPTTALPAFSVDSVPGPAMLVELPRSTAASALAFALDRELMRHVRGDRGLAYRAGAQYVTVSAERAAVIAHTDSVAEREQETVDAFLDVLFGMAADGPRAGLLGELLAARAAALDEPDAVGAIAHAGAREILLGRPLPDQRALLAEYSALTSEDLRQVASEAVRDALVLLPPGVRALGRGGFTRVSPADTAPVQGRRSRVPTSSDEVPVELIVGAEGVTRVRGEETTTIRYRDLAGLLRQQGGSRALVARSGDTLRIDPEVVGAERIGEIDAAAGQQLWINLPGPAPTATQPTAPPAAPTAQPAAPPPVAPPTITPRPVAPPKPIVPVAPLTTFQRFVVRPLRALLVLFVAMMVLGTVLPLSADNEAANAADMALVVVPILLAILDNVLYARRARDRNAAEAAHRAQDAPAAEDDKQTGAAA